MNEHHDVVVISSALYLGGPTLNLNLETGYPDRIFVVYLSLSKKDGIEP